MAEWASLRPHEKKALVHELHDGRTPGMSFAEIAAHLGITKNQAVGSYHLATKHAAAKRFAGQPRETRLFHGKAPKQWTEELLTEPYAERKLRLAKERAQQ